MALSYTLLALIAFSSFFLFTLLISPHLTSPLPTQIQCLDEPNSQFKRCVYCWTKPSQIHPKKTLNLNLPFTNYQFLSTKSCSKIACIDALQFFGNSNMIQNSTDISYYLNATNSEIQHHARQFKRIPSQLQSWKVFLTVPSGFHLPSIDSFSYLNSNIIYKLIIGEANAVALTLLTFLICFLSADKQQGYKDVSCLQVIFGMLSITLLFFASNFVDSRMTQMVLSGIAKALFVHYIINNVSAFHRLISFSVVSIFILISLSIYEAYYPTMLTGIFLLSLSVVLVIKSAAQHDAWSKQVFIGLLSMIAFSLSELILTKDEYYFWRIFRIYSVGIGISLLHTTKIIIRSNADLDRKPYEVAEEGSIVEMDESAL